MSVHSLLFEEIESMRQQLSEKVELNNQLADLLGDAEKQLADLLEANRIMCEDFAAENSKCSALEQQLAEAQKEHDELALIVATDTGTESAVADLQNQLADSQKHVTLLRCVVNKAAAHVRPTCNDLYEELMQAIDATEPKQ